MPEEEENIENEDELRSEGSSSVGSLDDFYESEDEETLQEYAQFLKTGVDLANLVYLIFLSKT